MKPRVAIVDDHTLFADACRTLLEPSCEVIGTYSDPRLFLSKAEALKPDVAILDLTMPSMNGLATAR